MLERVQKILAAAGLASRRKCEEFIAQGRVFVNNKKIKLGDKADAQKDVIRVNNTVIKLQKKVYFIVNKPRKYITTVADEFNRKTVMDLVDTREKVFPVGRLDRDARGLILLTNDGELANRIAHPRYNVEKAYWVTVREKLDDDDLKKLRQGIMIESRKVVPSKLVVINKQCVEITIHEGRKHIVKRLFHKLGYFVTDLLRTQVATLSLGSLKEGEYRELSSDELACLRRHLEIV